MTIQLLPFTTLAAGASGTADRLRAESHTLTLRLAASPPSWLGSATSGSVGAEDISASCEGVLRAAILPCDRPGLTITF